MGRDVFIEKVNNLACDLEASKTNLDAVLGRPSAAAVPLGGTKAGGLERRFSDIRRLSENY